MSGNIRNKIVIISYSNLSSRLNSFFGIEKLSDYIDIDFVNVTKITGDYEHMREIDNPKAKIIYVNNITEYESLVRNYPNTTLVVFDLYINRYTFNLYRILSQTECKIATTISGCLPTIKVSKFDRLTKLEVKDICKEISLVVNWLYNKIIQKSINRKLALCRAFDYIFYSGESALSAPVYHGGKTQYIGVNYLDYDEALFGTIEKILDYPYYLFLDQYLPFHPDNIINGMKKIDPIAYYKCLNEYFGKIEKEYNCEVVIAAHPKAEKYLNEDYFQGRKVVYNKTKSLIYYSIGVISHFTTAISYPIIYDKPICFIYTDGMIGQLTDTRVKAMANSLEARCYNISHESNNSFENINSKVREKFIFNYLSTKESKDRPNYETFYKIVKDLKKV